jgi:hypothetical protein
MKSGLGGIPRIFSSSNVHEYGYEGSSAPHHICRIAICGHKNKNLFHHEMYSTLIHYQTEQNFWGKKEISMEILMEIS